MAAAGSHSEPALLKQYYTYVEILIIEFMYPRLREREGEGVERCLCAGVMYVSDTAQTYIK